MLQSSVAKPVTLVFAAMMTLAGGSVVFAADMAPTPGAIPVSGSFDYTSEVFAQLAGGGTAFLDASENETWSGDIEGTSVAPFRVVIGPDGSVVAWINAELDGTVLGDYSGTMNIVSRYEKPAKTAHWIGEWIILGGTGDLKDVQGHGAAWGPGASGAGPGVPAINYSGVVIFASE